MLVIENKKLTILLFFLMTMGLVTGSQAQDTNFDDWDTDGNGMIERSEFNDVFTERFYDVWNPTDKRGLLEQDFFEESYAGLDTDHDSMLTDEEWLLGYNYYYKDYLVNGEISLVDSDSDGKIEFAEFQNSLYETRLFRDVDLDSDNYVSEWELADFVFDNWDLNDNGVIDRKEYMKFDWYYKDV